MLVPHSTTIRTTHPTGIWNESRLQFMFAFSKQLNYSKSFVVLRSCAMFAFLFRILFFWFAANKFYWFVLDSVQRRVGLHRGRTRTSQKNRERIKCIDGTSWPRFSAGSKQHFVFILAHSKLHISRLDASLDLCRAGPMNSTRASVFIVFDLMNSVCVRATAQLQQHIPFVFIWIYDFGITLMPLLFKLKLIYIYTCLCMSAARLRCRESVQDKNILVWHRINKWTHNENTMHRRTKIDRLALLSF